MKRALLVLLLAGGCAVPEPSSDEQRLLDVAWAEAMGMPGEAPAVDWVSGDRLDCTHKEGRGFLWEGRCLSGRWEVGQPAMVARDVGVPLAGTAICHEFTHAALHQTAGDADPGHRGAEWQTGGMLGRCWERLLNPAR